MICAHFFLNSCTLIIFNQNSILSFLQQHLSDGMFTGMRAGQPVTHMTSQQ